MGVVRRGLFGALGALGLVAIAVLGLALGSRQQRRPYAARMPGGLRASALDNGGPDAVAAAHFDSQLAARLGATARGYALAVQARRHLAAHGPVVPGGSGRWHPVASGPLVANDPRYPLSASDGYGQLSGRVVSFAFDPKHQQLFAAASQGGVWESDDLGGTWHSVGDNLPTQVLGAVGYTPADGGRVIAATGDSAFGAYTYGGLGVYWTGDRGRHWHHASGVPNGALSFRVAVDPTNPMVVYVATGMGLYRSADGGERFEDVDLPTGHCAGNSLLADCFLANVVTDVVVQAPDRFGHHGGAVLAAVGWRAGALQNLDGHPQSPANGLYSSPSGLPGTFARLAAPGFAPQPRIGRVALGVASGPDQNHDYVYAEVQDAVLFNTQKLLGLDIPSLPDPLGLGIDPTRTDTVLNGVYVSSDFGRSWHEMESGTAFELPGNGSAQTSDPGFELLGNYGPGIQAWFNEWIQPDPTRASSAGTPTRVLTGLEELWQTSSTMRAATGSESFDALAPYNGNRSPDCILELLQQLICNALPQHTVGAVHPDQHAGIWIPDRHGGAWLVIGNDGGIYRQHVVPGQELTAADFGVGSQTGLGTLEPYGVSVSADGTIWAGLQDNGTIKITPDGRQAQTLGGDGIFTAVNPSNSKIAYSTLPGGNVFITTDGGHSWRLATPGLETNSPFYTPIVLDPTDAMHVLTGGREIFDSVHGQNTAQSPNGVTIDPATDWNQVFDLGTRLEPGDPNAVSGGANDSENQVSALAVRGAAAYAGYCGDCDPVKDHSLFGSGIATNVGGTAAPAAGKPDGWHIAAARGLPHRIITSVAIDPANVRHVVVTLGSSTLRPYVPAGAIGSDGVALRAGSVYESFDAGASFVDASANLPAIGAAWVGFHGRQLVVADTVGVFATTSRHVSSTAFRSLHWGVLGRGLPHVSVFSFTFSPSHPDVLVAATFGRGVWSYRFEGARRHHQRRSHHRSHSGHHRSHSRHHRSHRKHHRSHRKHRGLHRGRHSHRGRGHPAG